MCGGALNNGAPYAITGADDHSVRVWDLDTYRQSDVIMAHRGRVRSSAVLDDPYSPLVATGDDDGTICLWEVMQGAQSVRSLRAHAGAVRDIAIRDLPDTGPLLLSAGDDRTVRVWNAVGQHLLTLEGHRAAVCATTFLSLPDGQLVVASADEDGEIVVWGPITPRCLRERTVCELSRITLDTPIHCLDGLKNGRLTIGTGTGLTVVEVRPSVLEALFP